MSLFRKGPKVYCQDCAFHFHTEDGDHICEITREVYDSPIKPNAHVFYDRCVFLNRHNNCRNFKPMTDTP